MKLYLKGDYTKTDFYDEFKEIAQKMWFKERNGKKISYSNVGDDECYKMIFTLVFGYTNGLLLMKDGIKLLL